MTLPVFDGHNDLLLRLHEDEAAERSFLEESSEGHLDLPRARRGGFAGGLFAVFVPGPKLAEPPDKPTGPYSLPLSPRVDPAEAYATAERLVELLLELERQDALAVVTSAAELEACLEAGTIAAVLHFEGAEPIRDLEDLDRLYERGLRTLGLVWSRANAYAEGVPFRFPASPDTGLG